jgi:hypothetical protein
MFSFELVGCRRGARGGRRVAAPPRQPLWRARVELLWHVAAQWFAPSEELAEEPARGSLGGAHRGASAQLPQRSSRRPDSKLGTAATRRHDVR